MKFCSDPMMMELSLGASALQTGLSAPLPLLIDQGILIRGVCTAGYPLCFLVLMLPTTVVHIYAKSDDRKSSGAGLYEILPSDQGFLGTQSDLRSIGNLPAPVMSHSQQDQPGHWDHKINQTRR